MKPRRSISHANDKCEFHTDLNGSTLTFASLYFRLNQLLVTVAMLCSELAAASGRVECLEDACHFQHSSATATVHPEVCTVHATAVPETGGDQSEVA